MSMGRLLGRCFSVTTGPPAAVLARLSTFLSTADAPVPGNDPPVVGPAHIDGAWIWTDRSSAIWRLIREQLCRRPEFTLNCAQAYLIIDNRLLYSIGALYPHIPAPCNPVTTPQINRTHRDSWSPDCAGARTNPNSSFGNVSTPIPFVCTGGCLLYCADTVHAVPWEEL